MDLNPRTTSVGAGGAGSFNRKQGEGVGELFQGRGRRGQTAHPLRTKGVFSGITAIFSKRRTGNALLRRKQKKRKTRFFIRRHARRLISESKEFC